MRTLYYCKGCERSWFDTTKCPVCGEEGKETRSATVLEKVAMIEVF